MQYNYFLLRVLCPLLEQNLRGRRLVSCFSQNRDELIMQFGDSTFSFFIRALLEPAFTCLTFPANFHRARKNSIDLFRDAVMSEVLAVRVVPHERSFTIDLSNSYTLLFKLHGNRSNILLLWRGQVMDLFKQNLVTDGSVTPEGLARSIDWSEASFFAHLHELPKHYPVFGKLVWSYLEQHGFSQSDAQTKWQLFQDCLSRLREPRFYLVEWQTHPTFSLLPIGNVLRTYAQPIEALNEFCARYLSEVTFTKQKSALLATLHADITKLESQLAGAENRLALLMQDHHYQQWADILMANLHRIPAGAEIMEAENFYDSNGPVQIPLRKELSAQKNAEVYYRKQKNQSIEIRQLQSIIAEKKTALDTARKKANFIRSATRSGELSGLEATKRRSENTKKLPFHLHQVAGFTVLVGKNAAGNDELLRSYAHKHDMWLHAKDAAGSHVIIKHQPGKEFPKPVLERAASLAAYYSKRKTEGLVPVAFTLCKYVRKRKGDPPGAVVIERDDILLVPPAASTI